MLDYEQHKRLVGLLESATDKKAPEIEAGSLKEIKEMVRNSNECIKSAYVVLMERLNAPHPQVVPLI